MAAVHYRLGNISAILNEIFAFVHEDYIRLILKPKKLFARKPRISMEVPLRAKLHKYFLEPILKCNAKKKYNILKCAASTCDLDLFKWVRANAGQIVMQGVELCVWATTGGNLEVLQWARANGCKWDLTICATAARFGHLELLKWARANVESITFVETV
jgi:hypothetical protein